MCTERRASSPPASTNLTASGTDALLTNHSSWEQARRGSPPSPWIDPDATAFGWYYEVSLSWPGPLSRPVTRDRPPNLVIALPKA